MVKENTFFRPFLVNVGVVVALSVAGFFYSRIKTKKIKRYLPPPKLLHASECLVEIDSRGNDRHKDILPTSEPEEMSMQRTSVDNVSFDLSPSNKHGGDFLLPAELSDNVVGTSLKLETETPPRLELELDTSRSFSRSAEKDDYEQEIKYLRNMVRMLSERERNLEIQLLEYYGLKEQETTVMELQNQLKMEAKLFSNKIESLQSENQRLEAQVADHARVIAELENARSKIKVFKKKLRHEAEQHRHQILNIQKRVARLQEQELKAPANDNNNQDSESNLERLKVLEIEAEELRKSNVRLQMENSELSQKLQSNQILPNSVLDNAEIEALNEMSNNLRQENQELTKQNEQLKAEKFTDVEELVYLRWVNACLRHELKNYQPLAGKTVARDLSKSLSPKSEEKAKKLILEYAKSQGSSIVDKGMLINNMDFDCDQLLHSSSQTPITTDDSSCENNSSSSASKPPANKIKFFKKLRLIRGKDKTSKADNQQEDADSPSSKSCSSATSLDIPRWRSLNMDQVKDEEKHRRNSDFGGYGYKRLMSGKDDDLESPVETQKLYQDTDLDLKADLLKFAEALKQQTPEKGKYQKGSSIV